MRKMSGEERRTAIIKAVQHLFAYKGFAGTTTRELAEAAGVSEALLYRHFPTKEALFTAIKQSFCDGEHRDNFNRLHELEPSTSTLVLLVHFLTTLIAGGGSACEDHTIPCRMLLRSLAEDGEFARLLLQPFAEKVIPRIEECLRAAIAAGEAEDGPVLPNLGGWFTHHLATMLASRFLPSTPVADPGLPRNDIVWQAVWFALRGLGLKEAAIRKYYNPKTLAVFGL